MQKFGINSDEKRNKNHSPSNEKKKDAGTNFMEKMNATAYGHQMTAVDMLSAASGLQMSADNVCSTMMGIVFNADLPQVLTVSAGI